jgi:glycosyltransferase involved in cell wall biosynthesis
MMLNVILDGRVINDHFPGIGRYAYHLTGALAQRGDVRLTVLYHPGLASMRYDLAALARSAPAITLHPIAIAPFTLAEQTRLAPLACTLKADVWHSLYYIMPFFRLPRFAPVVLTVYDLIPLVLPQYWSPQNRVIFRLAHILALRAARRVITLSESARQDLQHYFGARARSDRISVIPGAADEHFKPLTTDAITAIRERYHVPQRYVLYVGINKPPKNLVRLIEAFARVAKQVEHDCVIAGAWDDRYPEAKQRAAELQIDRRVRFLGPIADADLPGLYNGADWFITASLYEGFGLPALEAMACGTPVLCSNTSSLPEVVGDAAVLFDPTDVEVIARALEQALSDRVLRDRLREQGLQRAAQFTWSHAAAQTAEIYRTLNPLR